MGFSQSLMAGRPEEALAAGFAAQPSGTSNVLVLAASESSAVFCSNSNGVSRFLQTIKYDGRAEGRGKHLDGTPIAKERLARELATELEKLARGEHYEGVVIFSDVSLHRALCRHVTRRLPYLLVVCVNSLPEELPDMPALAGMPRHN
jgi:hypothetical protein